MEAPPERAVQEVDGWMLLESPQVGRLLEEVVEEGTWASRKSLKDSGKSCNASGPCIALRKLLVDWICSIFFV